MHLNVLRARAYVVKEAVEKAGLKSTLQNQTRATGGYPTTSARAGEKPQSSSCPRRGIDGVMDEPSGRTVAEALGLKTRGTLHVVLASIHMGLITSDEVRDTIASMIASGLRIEPHLHERVLREVATTGTARAQI